MRPGLMLLLYETIAELGTLHIDRWELGLAVDVHHGVLLVKGSSLRTGPQHLIVHDDLVTHDLLLVQTRARVSSTHFLKVRGRFMLVVVAKEFLHCAVTLLGGRLPCTEVFADLKDLRESRGFLLTYLGISVSLLSGSLGDLLIVALALGIPLGLSQVLLCNR